MSDAFCVFCGAFNPAGARYCAKCGKAQPAIAAGGHEPAASAGTAGGWRCPTCGTAYDAGVKVCTHCRTDARLKKAAHPANNAGFGILLLSAILGLPIGAALAVFIGGNAVMWWVIAAIIVAILGFARKAKVDAQRRVKTSRPQ